MPQWQFKLFDFDIKDDYDKNMEYVPGKDNKRFIVQMFGIDEEGKTASIFVRGFDPFFYVKVGDDWTNGDMMELINHIKKEVGSYYEDSLYKWQIVKRHKLYGFDNKKLHTFVQLKFKNMPALNKAKNLWYKDTTTNGVFQRNMRPGGIEFKDIKLELYEAQVPPLLRLFHIQEISPSGWIALLQGSYTQHIKKTTCCDYEFTINYSHIRPIPKKEKSVPYKILSVDIEASSSHGDFPLPKKNYKKLATNIVDICRTNEPTEDLLKRCVYTAFGQDNFANVDKVYTKEKIELNEIVEKFEEWIKVYPAKYAKMKALDDELKNQLIEEEKNKEDDDSDDNEDSDKELLGGGDTIVETYTFKRQKKVVKKYTKKEATIIDMLLDEDAERETKIQELTNTLTIHFPEIEGDKVTFIGSSFRYNGEDKPYLKHCIVVNTCDPVENAVIESYTTEKEALLAWTALIKREDPDVVIGYNVHGWDYGFMYERTQELNCTKQFLQLSRNKNEICLKKDWKTQKETIEENTLVIASGQYDIKYYKMTGRLQIDFLNLFRREHQLSSYKLDYVSGHFIGDNIKEIILNKKEIENGGVEVSSTVKTKNLIGLENDDFIIIEEIGHTTDLYDGGRKFKIKNLQKDSFDIDGEITPDKTKTLRWCLGKDDVTPQDIFRLTNQGPKERAIVAKYCIKDTTLVQDLMRKNDTMTGCVEMANICSVPISFLQTRGQGIKLTSFVAKKCRQKDTLMPVIEKSMDDEGYEGATVLTPKSGLYLDNPVACVDYSSLYPSSIISENLSHDSKVWTKEYDLEGNLLKEWGENEYDNLPGYEYVDVTYDTFKWIRKTLKAAKTKQLAGYKTCRFIQFKEGKAILPSILEELLAARKATKKLMKNETDAFMANVYDKRQQSIKVTANSLYGQCGARTSTFFEKDVAASTTATGRKLLMYAKAVVETAYGDSTQETKKYGKVLTKAEYIYGDSVANYTPVNVRVNKEKIEICTIEELAKKYGNNNWCNSTCNQKEMCELSNIESWTENGWTKCYRIIRHKLASHKKMMRILTHTGVVDVTDDHSLVQNNGEEISPKDVEIGTKLLHSTVELNPLIIKENNITKEEAQIMGFFFGDGSCGVYNCPSGKKASWALNNSNEELLDKYFKLCEKVYSDFEWKIYNTIQSCGVNKLCFNNNNRGSKIVFIENYRSKLYYNNCKIIPTEIINGTDEIRLAFWEGLYDADGDKDKNGYTRIDQKNQISASHICLLANSLGYKTSINIRNDKMNVYRVTATKGKQRKDPDAIKKIVELVDYINEENNGYVYDLTTENHHFAAGIGNMIVHNTDSVFFTFNLTELDGTKIIGKKALEITIDLAQDAGALATKYLKAPHDLEYEKTFLPFCLLSKKRYVGMLHEFDPEKGKRKSMGIVLKRRDNAPIVKDIYGGVIDILMKDQVVHKAVTWVKYCLQNMIDEKYPLNKLVITKSLRSNYKNPMQIAHNVLAQRIGEREPGNKPGPGDRIPFAYIKVANKKVLQGEKIENPKYIVDNDLKIDYGFYITNQIMKPLQQVFALVLEELPEFRAKRGRQDKDNPHGSWKKDIDKLHEKWVDNEKFMKKYEEFRCKEVKSILFDEYIKQVK